MMVYYLKGNMYLIKGIFTKCRLINVKTVSSHLTIFPTIKATGIAGNPIRSINGSARSMTANPCLWPTTYSSIQL